MSFIIRASIYELEYEDILDPNVLVTLKQLNLHQTIAEIERMIRYMSKHPAPSIELIAHVETNYDGRPNSYYSTHRNEWKTLKQNS